MFFIKDEKFITVEKMGGRDASYDDFLTDLQSGGEGECRYGLYDFEYEHQCQVNISRSCQLLLGVMPSKYFHFGSDSNPFRLHFVGAIVLFIRNNLLFHNISSCSDVRK